MDDNKGMSTATSNGSGGSNGDLAEMARGIDPGKAKAEVDRMVAEGKVDRGTVDALVNGAKSMLGLF